MRVESIVGAAVGVTLALFACVSDEQAISGTASDSGAPDTSPGIDATPSQPDAEPCGDTGCGREAVSVGSGSTTCVVLREGSVWCWGYNAYGTAGQAPSAMVTDPTKVKGIEDAVQIDLVQHVVCAVTRAGAVMCWGRNDFGETGRALPDSDPSCGAGTPEEPTAKCSSVPTAVHGLPQGAKATKVVLGNTDNKTLFSPFGCALLDNATVWCWGNNGAAATGRTPTTGTFTAQRIASITGATDIAASFRGHACAVVANGAVQCWGANTRGQLGHTPGTAGDIADCNGITGVFCNPTAQGVGTFSGATRIALGAFSTCALTPIGVSCWGSNANCLLGNGQSPADGTQVTPSPVVGLPTGLVDIRGHYSTAYALTASGAVWAWGDNSYGSLGAGDIAGATSGDGQICTTTPRQTKLPEGTEVTSVERRRSSSCSADRRVRGVPTRFKDGDTRVAKLEAASTKSRRVVPTRTRARARVDDYGITSNTERA